MMGLDSPVLQPLDHNQGNGTPKSGTSSPSKSLRPSSSGSGSVSPLRKSPLRPSSPIRRVLQVQRDTPSFTIYTASEEEEKETMRQTQLLPKMEMFEDENPKENMGETTGKKSPGKRLSPGKLGRTPLEEHWPNLQRSKVTKPLSPAKRLPFTPLSTIDHPAFISRGKKKENQNVLLTSAKGLAVFNDAFTYELPVYVTPPRKRRLSTPAPDTRTSITQPLIQTWRKTAFPVFQDDCEPTN